MRESPPPRSHVSYEARWGGGKGKAPPPPSQTGNPVDRGLLGFFTLFQAHAFLFSHAGIKDVYSVQRTSHHASHQYTSHIFLSSHFHHLLCTAAQALKTYSRSDDQNSQKFWKKQIKKEYGMNWWWKKIKSFNRVFCGNWSRLTDYLLSISKARIGCKMCKFWFKKLCEAIYNPINWEDLRLHKE